MTKSAVRILLLVLAIIGLGALPWQSASAAWVPFQWVPSNNGNPDISSQLWVDVIDPGTAGSVDFKFYNLVGTASSITDVYFDDGTLLSMGAITSSAGVSFSAPANPGDLPGGNTIGFVTTAGFSADSDSPVMSNGVNAASEWLNINFTLQNNPVTGNPLAWADVMAALQSGDLKIGMHVQSIDGDGSDAYVNGPPGGAPPPTVPEPGTLLLLGIGLIGVGAVARKKIKK